MPIQGAYPIFLGIEEPYFDYGHAFAAILPVPLHMRSG